MNPLTIPNYTQSLADKAGTARAWYAFWSGLAKGQPPGAESTVTVGTSPFSVQTTQKGFYIVQGGTVTLVQWARGTTNHSLGATQGAFPVSQGDTLIITYSAAPTVTFVPQ